MESSKSDPPQYPGSEPAENPPDYSQLPTDHPNPCYPETAQSISAENPPDQPFVATTTKSAYSPHPTAATQDQQYPILGQPTAPTQEIHPTYTFTETQGAYVLQPSAATQEPNPPYTFTETHGAYLLHPTAETQDPHPPYTITGTQGANAPQPSATAQEPPPPYPTTGTQVAYLRQPTAATQNPHPPYTITGTQGAYLRQPTAATQSVYQPYPAAAIQDPAGPYTVYPTNYTDLHQQYGPRVQTTQVLYPTPMVSTLYPVQGQYPRTASPGPHLQMVNQPVSSAPQQGYIATDQHSGSHTSGILICSLLSMIFCFCPLGLAALLCSIQARDAKKRQDWTATRKYSNIAASLCLISLMLGFLTYSLVFIMTLVAKQRISY